MPWAIDQLRRDQSLSMSQMTEVMDTIMRGQWNNADLVEFLTLLYHKGETVDELAGAARSLQNWMTVIESNHEKLIDTCGTGGSGKGTFNISTAAALVATAAGAKVAKHGNRGVTSKSGSADVLAALGVNIESSIDRVQECLDEVGLCFCFAPLFHSSVRHATAARRQLAFPTIFNLLGPLCNPAQAPYQLLGAGRGARGPCARSGPRPLD